MLQNWNQVWLMKVDIIIEIVCWSLEEILTIWLLNIVLYQICFGKWVFTGQVAIEI